jgi:hypothetical protein
MGLRLIFNEICAFIFGVDAIEKAQSRHCPAIPPGGRTTNRLRTLIAPKKNSLTRAPWGYFWGYTRTMS